MPLLEVLHPFKEDANSRGMRFDDYMLPSSKQVGKEFCASAASAAACAFVPPLEIVDEKKAPEIAAPDIKRGPVSAGSEGISD